MVEPLKNLADFKRRAVPGARFLRSFPGRETPSRIVTVAFAQSNAVVFPLNGVEPTPDVLKRIADNPGRNGSWFWFPKAKHCRFEDGAMIVLDAEDRPIVAYALIADDAKKAEAARGRGGLSRE
jgi:hypothetical protein